jgi:hypothetical protein
MYVISKERGYRRLKEGVTLEHYRTKYPSAIACNKAPSLGTIEKWDEQGYCKTPCGCRVEPDGVCTHGQQSWMLIMGLI